MNGVDALTGLPTYVGLRAALRESVAAIFLDIDGLRFVNDCRGHLAGDRVLAGLGAWLKREAEALHGLVFRVAGDEFILLLPGRTLEEAAEIASRLVDFSREGITLSAVVFRADPGLPERLRDTLEAFAEELYHCEVRRARTHGNVVVAGME